MFLGRRMRDRGVPAHSGPDEREPDGLYWPLKRSGGLIVAGRALVALDKPYDAQEDPLDYGPTGLVAHEMTHGFYLDHCKTLDRGGQHCIMNDPPLKPETERAKVEYEEVYCRTCVAGVRRYVEHWMARTPVGAARS